MQMGWLLALALALILVAIALSVRRSRRTGATAGRQAKSPLAASPDLSAISPDEQALVIAGAFEKFHKLAFNVRTLRLYSAQAHDGVIAATEAALSASSGELRYAPRRPLMLPQLLRAVNDDEASRQEIGAIIGRDPALAGNLLRLANTAFYRVRAQPVESIDRAIAVLGTEGIRSLIAAALLQPVFRSSGGAFTKFPEMTWDHTTFAAGAAEVCAAGFEDADPFAAQLLGMLMGLGTIIVFRATLDQYGVAGTPQPDAAIVAMLIDKHAAAVGRSVAGSWQLSTPMLEALAEQQSQGALQALSPLGQCLRAGRLAGALALLRHHEVMADEEARAALIQGGVPAGRADRIWARLNHPD